MFCHEAGLVAADMETSGRPAVNPRANWNRIPPSCNDHWHIPAASQRTDATPLVIPMNGSDYPRCCSSRPILLSARDRGRRARANQLASRELLPCLYPCAKRSEGATALVCIHFHVGHADGVDDAHARYFDPNSSDSARQGTSWITSSNRTSNRLLRSWGGASSQCW